MKNSLLYCKCKNCGSRSISFWGKFISRAKKPVLCGSCGAKYYVSTLTLFFINFVLITIAPTLFFVAVTFQPFYSAIFSWFICMLLIISAAIYFAPSKLHKEKKVGDD